MQYPFSVNEKVVIKVFLTLFLYFIYYCCCIQLDEEFEGHAESYREIGGHRKSLLERKQLSPHNVAMAGEFRAHSFTGMSDNLNVAIIRMDLCDSSNLKTYSL